MTEISVETPKIDETMTTNMLELNDEQLDVVSGGSSGGKIPHDIGLGDALTTLKIAVGLIPSLGDALKPGGSLLHRLVSSSRL